VLARIYQKIAQTLPAVRKFPPRIVANREGCEPAEVSHIGRTSAQFADRFISHLQIPNVVMSDRRQEATPGMYLSFGNVGKTAGPFRFLARAAGCAHS